MLPKVVLSSQTPEHTELMKPSPTEEKDSAPHTRGQAPFPPTKKPEEVSGPVSPISGQTPEARGTITLQSAERKLEIQSVRQNEMIEIYVADERAR